MEIGSNGTALMFNNESIADADAAARAMSIFSECVYGSSSSKGWFGGWVGGENMMAMRLYEGGRSSNEMRWCVSVVSSEMVGSDWPGIFFSVGLSIKSMLNK